MIGGVRRVGRVHNGAGLERIDCISQTGKISIKVKVKKGFQGTSRAHRRIFNTATGFIDSKALGGCIKKRARGF
jgi:hypothetical protein